MELIIGSRFNIRRRIGGGSFGEIFVGTDMENDQEVALKLEPTRTRSPQLEFESKIYKILEDGVGIPKIIWFGKEAKYSIMVMEKLGSSLEDLFQLHRNKMSLKTVLMIADQTLSLIQFMHQRNVLHRDIKPDNFVMGLGERENQVYVIDFGLSKRYRDPKTHQHIQLIEHKSLTGTARYASLNAMKGLEQSRRDDLESLGYVWMYLLRGSLPWQGLAAKTQEEKMDRITEVKMSTTFEALCDGFPEVFVTFFQNVRKLRFQEEPNYTELKRMFRDLLLKEGYSYDYQYDWTSNIFNRPLKPIPKQVMALPPQPQPNTQPPSANASPRESDDLKPVAMAPGRGNHQLVPRIFDVKPQKQVQQRATMMARHRGSEVQHPMMTASSPHFKSGIPKPPVRTAAPSPRATKGKRPTIATRMGRVVLPKIPESKRED